MSEQGDNEDDIDLERVARSLRRRVASRRAAGEYPEGLEEGLDEHFRRLVAQRPTEVSTATFDERIRALDSTRFDSGSIPVQSGLPGGSMYHRSVLKAVSRPLHRIAQQFDEVRVATVAALAEASDLVGQLDTRAQPLEGELSAMHARLTDLERQVVITERLADKIDELLVGSSGEAGTTELFFDYEAFEQRFRGDPQVLLARYTELAGLFDGLAPVLDVGCGAGEFLELLRQRQIESFGVDLDPSMIDKALAMGVDARLGDALETLDTQPDRTLGGIVSLQVIEHLDAGVTARLVELAAQKLHAGGRLILETPNVAVLGTHANAWVLDPTHIRPVHPDYLAFVCEQAGFSKVELRYESTPSRRLEPLEGDDANTGIHNRNLELLNEVLFGPQDVAVIATR